MLYEMIFGHPPWTGKNFESLFKSIEKDSLKFPEKNEVDKKLKDLISKMLVIDQDKRLDLEGVLQHECLKDLEESKFREEEETKKTKKCSVKKTPQLIIYLKNKTEFFNNLANKIVEMENLTKDIRRQLVMLLLKVAVIFSNKIIKIISINKKEISEIKEISLEDFESGILKSFRPKYEALLKTQRDVLAQSIESYKKYIQKFPQSFSENVINDGVLEMTPSFLGEYKRIFDLTIGQIRDKIEEIEIMKGEENEEFFKTLFMLIKVRRVKMLDAVFESGKKDAFEEIQEEIEMMKGDKAKEKAMKMVFI